MRGIETKIANQIAGGQAVHYEVTPIYPARPTGIPLLIHIVARGNRGMDVDCYVRNTAVSGPGLRPGKWCTGSHLIRAFVLASE
ncbi:hypothetical protein Stsp02_76480 [Streptomyces sp. NBRC 14336]|nr:hypothetical protein Stsp02_76480 [Streptomyces sp. NBRC 14336]